MTHSSIHVLYSCYRRSALQIWKNNDRLNATFESLLDICLRGGDSKTAEEICVYIRDNVPEGEWHTCNLLLHTCMCNVKGVKMLDLRLELIQQPHACSGQ